MDVRAARCPFTEVPLPPALDENLPRALCAPAHSATGSAGATIPGISPSPRSGSRTPRHKRTSSWTSSISSTMTPSSPFATCGRKTGSSPRCLETPPRHESLQMSTYVPSSPATMPPYSTWVSCTPSSWSPARSSGSSGPSSPSTRPACGNSAQGRLRGARTADRFITIIARIIALLLILALSVLSRAVWTSV